MDRFLQVKCPNCGKEMKARRELAGKRVKCSRATCHGIFTVPVMEPDPETVPTPPAPFPVLDLASTSATPPTPVVHRPKVASKGRDDSDSKPTEPDDGVPDLDSKVILKWTIGASVGFLAIMMLLVLGLFWRVGQPTAEQVKIYEAYLRTGNELADLNDQLHASRSFEDDSRRESIMSQHVAHLAQVDAIPRRRKSKLQSRYDQETAALLERQKTQLASNYANLIVVVQSKEGEFSIHRRRDGKTSSLISKKLQHDDSSGPYGYADPIQYVDDMPRMETKPAEPVPFEPAPRPVPGVPK